MSLEFITVETAINPTAAIIWLHGLGADGHDFESIAEELDLPPNVAIRFIFPHAPVQPVTINGGMRMRAWYDIAEVNLMRTIDKQGIFDNAILVQELIDQQIQLGISSDKIILAGFSQGGVLALHLGVRQKSPIAGVMALSTYAPTIDQVEMLQKGLPVYIGHGTVDPVVSVELAFEAKAKLEKMGCNVACKTYAMPHSVCTQELKDISAWISTVL